MEALLFEVEPKETPVHVLFKYNIHARLANITNGHLIKDKIRKRCGISQPTMQKYLNITIDDKRSMPLDVAFQFAQYFGCKIDELYTKEKEAA